jgi:hypothetical protein
MQKHQVCIDLRDGKANARTVETIEVPPGHRYYRAYDDSLRLITRERLHSGDTWIVTSWHDDERGAWAEAAAELEHRMQALASLRLICLAGLEVIHG